MIAIFLALVFVLDENVVRMNNMEGCFHLLFVAISKHSFYSQNSLTFSKMASWKLCST